MVTGVFVDVSTFLGEAGTLGLVTVGVVVFVVDAVVVVVGFVVVVEGVGVLANVDFSGAVLETVGCVVVVFVVDGVGVGVGVGVGAGVSMSSDNKVRFFPERSRISWALASASCGKSLSYKIVNFHVLNIFLCIFYNHVFHVNRWRERIHKKILIQKW